VIDTQSDPNNCGACFNVCTAANGFPVCVNGVCGVSACEPGYLDCDGNPAHGCETNLRDDPDNCGSCSNVCGTRANATTSCTAGACRLSCNSGWGDCNMLAADGCEVDLLAADHNCGRCGNACLSGTHCASGACVSG
jgi:hypothetical protein